MRDRKEPLIEIILATYNGSQYINDLLNSLEIQTYQFWRLLVRDDGSTDGTIEIIEKFCQKLKEQNKTFEIKIIHDDLGNLGPVGNFSHLLEQTTAEYVMFADQDDIWLPKKIEKTLRFMRKREKEMGDIKHPILIHTDLIVIDENKNIIDPSFWHMQKLNPKCGFSVNKLLFHNVVTGCTMMLNRAAVGRVIPIPKSAVMHDYWIAIIIAKFGLVDFLPERTIKYRQHQNNKIGAKNINFIYFKSTIIHFFKDINKFIRMFQELPFRPHVLLGLLHKILISLERILLPRNCFFFINSNSQIFLK